MRKPSAGITGKMRAVRLVSCALAVVLVGCTNSFVVHGQDQYQQTLDLHECRQYAYTKTVMVPVGGMLVAKQKEDWDVVDACMAKRGYTPDGWGWSRFKQGEPEPPSQPPSAFQQRLRGAIEQTNAQIDCSRIQREDWKPECYRLQQQRQTPSRPSGDQDSVSFH